MTFPPRRPRHLARDRDRLPDAPAPHGRNPPPRCEFGLRALTPARLSPFVRAPRSAPWFPAASWP